MIGLIRATRNTETVPSQHPRTGDLSRVYTGFLGLTTINPTTVVYFAAVVIGLGVARGMSPADGVLFVSEAFLSSLSWQTAIAAAGAFAGRRLPTWARVAVSVLGNLVILGFGLVILSG